MGQSTSLNHLSDLKLDPNNANAGTDRGLELLRESIDTCGVGRSIVVDKHGVVISGNKTLQVALAKGIGIEVVQSDGHELVVVQRSDLDLLEQRKARQLSYYDNRVQELDLVWSPRQIQQDLLDGLDLSSSFFPEELDKITAGLEAAPDALADVDTREAPVVEPAADPESSPVPPAPPAVPAPPSAQKPSFSVTFGNIAHQVRWASLMRVLRDRYPDAKTQSERLSLYLTSQGIVA